ncbi:Lar family restriction alleviation protein [Seleniivibrio woodruffii]|uniref:Lar family restriction alleviation protein n=1 Tax=Seleniivibrio woodruffii TaxID=1078050 RepID=UPI00240A8930|nr:Lar family restriction alleviation protein [Seleniivibrio woodruffii]
MSKLKPCPFCGGVPTISETEGCDYTIQCACCGLSLLDDMDWDGIGYDARQNVIDKWNTRPIEDAQSAEIETLKAKVAELGTFLHNEKVRADAYMELTTELKAENSRLREALGKYITTYKSSCDEWFCLNCGITGATFEERCDRCGSDLNHDFAGMISEIEKLLKGEE